MKTTLRSSHARCVAHSDLVKMPIPAAAVTNIVPAVATVLLAAVRIDRQVQVEARAAEVAGRTEETVDGQARSPLGSNRSRSRSSHTRSRNNPNNRSDNSKTSRKASSSKIQPQSTLESCSKSVWPLWRYWVVVPRSPTTRSRPIPLASQRKPGDTAEARIVSMDLTLSPPVEASASKTNRRRPNKCLTVQVTP